MVHGFTCDCFSPLPKATSDECLARGRLYAANVGVVFRGFVA